MPENTYPRMESDVIALQQDIKTLQQEIAFTLSLCDIYGHVEDEHASQIIASIEEIKDDICNFVSDASNLKNI